MAEVAELRDQGQYEEAEKIQAVVVVGVVRILGFERPNSLTCMNTLLAIWEYQGMEDSTRGKVFLDFLKNAVSRTTQRHSELEETSNNTLALGEASECQRGREFNCHNCAMIQV